MTTPDPWAGVLADVEQLVVIADDTQAQLRGPALAGWPSLGTNPQGQNLTVVDALAAVKTKVAASQSPPQPAYRPIWIYSAPGSGATWWEGPPFEVGQWAQQVLNINHQPVGYPMGGYLGLLGGDSSLSYNQVIADEAAELTRLLGLNPDCQAALAKRQANPTADLTGMFEGWFVAYSQSADGMVAAVYSLFGPGGQYELLQDRINGLLMFGNPARANEPARLGNGWYLDAPGWGISRKVYPAWLNALTYSITATSPDGPDFYAACADDIRPLFYEIIVQANTSLSFFELMCQVIIPILIENFAPFLGSLGTIVEAVATPILAVATGLSSDLVSQAVAAANGPTDAQTIAALTQMMTLQGVISNIPGLITLLGDLGGIQTHGSYDDPHPEFNNLTGVQVACNVMAAFRR